MKVSYREKSTGKETTDEHRRNKEERIVSQRASYKHPAVAERGWGSYPLTNQQK